MTNSGAGGVGLYASGGDDAGADLVLGSNSSTDNDGVIISDPAIAGSDIKLKSNTYVEITLDSNNDDANSTFTIRDGTSAARFRVYESGNVYADGGYNCGINITGTGLGGTLTEVDLDPCLSDNSPADFAEMLPAQGGLDPGDVLVIGPDGKLARSTTLYQTTVVGIYSTRPSYLGGSRYWGQSGYAPLAVIGVVLVKASAENGSIHPGDALTTSSIPGHAMRADSVTLNGITFYPSGVIIGKALEELDKSTGLILMLVLLQ